MCWRERKSTDAGLSANFLVPDAQRGIELMLNAVNLSFVTFSYQHKEVNGHLFAFFVMVVAAAEAAVGLAIILTIFKNRATLNIDEMDSMKN